VNRERTRLRRRLLTLGYGVFYRLPQAWRTRVVKLITPRYVLGSVVLIFDSETEEPKRILLLRQPPGRGWTLPAGLLEKHETPIAGAIREAHEETGILLTTDQVTPALPNAVVHTKGHWVDMVFKASVPASSTELSVDGAEVWEAAWHPVDNLPKLTVATARLLEHYAVGADDRT
jgi:8-oxo-dGTP pyrophosphatase MutT (NUDIX family)